MSSGPENDRPNPESLFKVRLARAARSLVLASQLPTTDGVTKLGPEIASLAELRFDPEVVDYDSVQFKAGASEALAMVSYDLLEYILHPSEVARLQADGVATTIAAVAAKPGIGPEAINRYHDDDKARKHINILSDMVLVEPAQPTAEDHGWQLTPQGKANFLRLLPHHLAPHLTDREIADAVVGIVRSYQPALEN